MDATQRLDLITGLSLSDAETSSGCCGGGCMCGGGAASERTPSDRVVTDPIGMSSPELPTTTAQAGTEFLVTGMTCGHCVSSVTEEVGAIDGVESVEVVLKKGGASRVTVTSASPIDADAVRAAVEEAGYQLA